MHSSEWIAGRLRMPGVLAALTGCLALVACGGSNNASSGGGGGSGGGTVTVGVLIPLTGELGQFGKGWQNAASLAVDQLNSSGVLKGMKIKTVVADDKANAQTSVGEARKMISTQHVSAIVGPTSEPMVALVPIAKRDQIPIMSGAAGTVALNNLGGDYIYRTVASDASDGLAQATFLEEQGAKQVAQLVENDASPISVATTFKQAFAKKGGTITKSITFNPSQASYRTQVAQILSSNPQWIECACGQQSGATIIKEVHDSGYNGKWMVASDIATDDFVKTVGANVMNNVFYSESPSSDQTTSVYKDFADAYKQKFGKAPGLLDENVYDAMMIVGLAIAKSGSSKGADINAAIRDVADPPGTNVSTAEQAAQALKGGGDIDYQGASGPVDFDKTGSVTTSYAVIQVQKGSWKQIKFLPANVFAGQ